MNVGGDIGGGRVCPYRKGWFCTVTGKMLGPLACGVCKYWNGRQMTPAGTLAVAWKKTARERGIPPEK